MFGARRGHETAPHDRDDEGEGEALWFLGCLVTVKSAAESTGGRVAVLEHLAPRGAGVTAPRPQSRGQWFYVLEGELTFWVGGEGIDAPAGAFVYGPAGIPHTFVVSSEQAHFLLVTEPAGLEQMVRAVGTPAPEPVIPPVPTEPPDMAPLMAAAAAAGIEIVGPPGIPA